MVEVNPERHIGLLETQRGINEVLKTLYPQEEFVVRARFGLTPMSMVEDRAYRQARTLEELSRELCVSRARVMEIERKALRKLRHYSRIHKLAQLPRLP